jgi:DNA-binding transcriptional LysR family regulator
MLELTRLKVFCEVATHCSFTKAAETLGYAQPSISHHIAQLERELGAQLFDRQPRRLQLTDAGQVFLDYARPVLTQLADAQREVAETIRSGGGRLRVAAFPTAAATLMPAAAGPFRASRPNVELGMTEVDPPLALPGLIDGDFDLALVYDYPMLGAARDPAVELEPLFGDPMAVVLPAGHRLADRTTVALEELSREPWITPHSSVCHDALFLACRNAGFTPNAVTQTNDYMAMQGLVAAGIGVAVLPRLAVAMARRPGVVITRLTKPVIERITFVATRKGAYRSQVAEAFRSTLRGAVGSAEDPGLPLEIYDLAHAAGLPESS